MDARAEKIRIPLQLGSVLRITKDGQISVSNPQVEMEPSEAVADAVLDYSFDPRTGDHFIQVVEPLSYKPRP
jgi:hypothetical protein